MIGDKSWPPLIARGQEIPVVFLDFEGGLHSGIIEYGWVLVSGGTIAEIKTRLCQPTGPIKAEETEVHGIRLRDTRGQEPFAREWEPFAQSRRQAAFGAHAASYENRLLKSVWPFPGTCPDFLRGGNISQWGPWIDSCLVARHFFPDWENHRLADVVQKLKLQETLDHYAAKSCPEKRRRYHCAGYDALASALIVLEILSRVPPEYRDLAQIHGHGDENNQQSEFDW